MESELEERQQALEERAAKENIGIMQTPQLRKRHREEIKQLNRKATSHAVSVLLHELKDRYHDLPEVVTFLDEIERDIRMPSNSANRKRRRNRSSPGMHRDYTTAMKSMCSCTTKPMRTHR